MITTSLNGCSSVNPIIIPPLRLDSYVNNQLETDLLAQRASSQSTHPSELSDEVIEEYDDDDDDDNEDDNDNYDVLSSDSSSLTSSKRTVNTDNHHQWFQQFPWLEINASKDSLTCRICTLSGKDNGCFTKGKSLENLKKDDFIQHQSGAQHTAAEAEYIRAKNVLADSLPLAQNNGNVNDSSSETSSPAAPPYKRRRKTNGEEKKHQNLNLATNNIYDDIITNKLQHQRQLVAAQMFAMQSLQTDPTYFMQQYISALYGLQQQQQQQQSVSADQIPNIFNMSTTSSPLSTMGINLSNKKLNELSTTTTINGSNGNGDNINDDKKHRLPPQPITSNKDGKRRFQEYWFDQFPWLKFDKATQLFYCKYCRETGRNNSFAEGKRIVKNPKKHHFVQHQMTADHQGAVSNLGLPADNIKNVVKRRNLSVNLADDNKASIRIKQTPPIRSPSPPQQPPPTQVPLDLSHSNSVKESSKTQQSIKLEISNEKEEGLNVDENELYNWKREFSWLKSIPGRCNTIFCLYCKQFAMPGQSIWSNGGISIPSSKDVLYSHESCKEHQQAVRLSLSYSSNLFSKGDNYNLLKNSVGDCNTAKSTTSSDDNDDHDSIKSTSNDLELLSAADRNKIDKQHQQKRAHSRKTISKWLKAYSWLRHNDLTDRYTCRLCQEDDRDDNLWSEGIEAYRIDRETINLHEKDERHISMKKEKKQKNNNLQVDDCLPNAEWFMEFSWLQLSHKSNGSTFLHCKFCKNSVNPTTTTTTDELTSNNGMEIEKADRNLFEKHALTSTHKNILEIENHID